MDRERGWQRESGRPGPSRRRSVVLLAMLAALVAAGCGTSGSDGVATDDVDPASQAPDVAEDAPVDDVESAISSGGGTGSVTIDGTEYAFTSDYCIGMAKSFESIGAGEVAGGTFTVEITVDDSSLDVDGDGTPDKTGNVSLTVGAEEAIYRSTVLVSGSSDVQEFTFELADGSVTGSGQVTDAMGSTQKSEFEFTAACG